MEKTLHHALTQVDVLKPDFVSVTYGAGGSTRQRTHTVVQNILNTLTTPPAAHVTCANESRHRLLEILHNYHAMGVRHIVALRGDMPNMEPYTPHKQGFQTTPDFIKAIRGVGDFEVTVAAYPEKHPDSPSKAHDMDVLKRKIDAGATKAITQFTLDYNLILDFYDNLEKHGIKIPVIPGIMPVINFANTARMAHKVNVKVPQELATAYGAYSQKEDWEKLAHHYAVTWCQTLQDIGCNTFHFYTMNNMGIITRICQTLAGTPYQPVDDTTGGEKTAEKVIKKS